MERVVIKVTTSLWKFAMRKYETDNFNSVDLPSKCYFRYLEKNDLLRH